MHEKSGLPRVHIQNTTLPEVEYEIQEALNGTSIDRNQDQRRNSRSFAQCPKSRMKPHAAVRLLRNLSIETAHAGRNAETAIGVGLIGLELAAYPTTLLMDSSGTAQDFLNDDMISG
jgi:hypothetical protein